MSENAFLAAFFFPAAAAVLVFFMKYVSAVLQARVRLSPRNSDESHDRTSRDGGSAFLLG